MSALEGRGAFDDYLGILEMAAFLPMHHTRVRAHIKAGRLPARLVFGRYMIHKDDAERFRAAYYATGTTMGPESGLRKTNAGRLL